MTSDELLPQPTTTFVAMGVRERQDIQRLLRAAISTLGEKLLVVSEEFGHWVDARRRIDLLAVDRSGHLVVIELKRDETGGHMELQAIRYAAMVSTMDFEEVADAYADHCARYRQDEVVDARAELVAFIDAGDGEEPTISTEVRIVLVAADFGREITTTVLWLNGFEGMDIRCVRLVPYDIDGRLFVDVQQVLPLPEAAAYIVHRRRKDVAQERARTDGRDLTQFHVIVEGVVLEKQRKRQAMRTMIEQLASRGVPVATIWEQFNTQSFRVLEGPLRDGDSVREALLAQYPGIDTRRWFCDHALVDEAAGKTYVLTKMWGASTELTMAMLVAEFPEAKVTFRRADSDGTTPED
jgi:hypothetical protein